MHKMTPGERAVKVMKRMLRGKWLPQFFLFELKDWLLPQISRNPGATERSIDYLLDMSGSLDGFPLLALRDLQLGHFLLSVEDYRRVQARLECQWHEGDIPVYSDKPWQQRVALWQKDVERILLEEHVIETPDELWGKIRTKENPYPVCTPK